MYTRILKAVIFLVFSQLNTLKPKGQFMYINWLQSRTIDKDYKMCVYIDISLSITIKNHNV